MAGEVFKLSLLLEYKGDGAAKGVDGLVKLLQKLQAEGKKTITVYNNLQKSVNKGFKVESPKGLKNLKKDLTDISKQFDQVAKKGRGVFSDTASASPRSKPQNPKDAKDELDKLFKPERRGAVQRLADLNDKVFQPAAQIKDVWKQGYDSLHQYTEEAKKLYLAQAKFKLINLSPEENRRAFDAVTKSVREMGLTTRTEGIETLTDLHTALGSLDHALEALPMASKYRFSMETLFGEKFSSNQIEEQIQNAFKFLEVTGKVAKGREEMEKGFNVMTQMTSATGGRVTPSEMLLMARRGGSSLRNVSPEGLRNLSAPIQELGGSGTGVAMMTLRQALVGGVMKESAAMRFQQLGLLDESKIEYNKAGRIKRLLPGANKLGDLSMSDPLSAADALKQAMLAHGVKDDPKEISKELSILFQNRTAQNLMDILINQRSQVTKEAGLASNAQNNEQMFAGIDDNLKNIQKAEKAWSDFKAEIGAPLIETIGGVTKALLPIGKFFGEHQDISRWTIYAFGAVKAVKLLSETASILSSSGSFLTSFFRNSQSSAEGASKAIGNTSNAIGGLQSKKIGIGLQIASVVGIDLLIRLIQWEVEQAMAAGKAQENARKEIKTGSKVFDDYVADLASRGDKPTDKFIDSEARKNLKAVGDLGLNDVLRSEILKKPIWSWSGDSMLSTAARQTFLAPLSPENKFSGGAFSGFGDVKGLAKGFKETAPTLKNPDVMMAFLPKLEQMIKDKSDLQSAKQGLALAFPDAYKQASESLFQNQSQFSKTVGGLTENFSSLQQLFNPQNTNFIGQFGESLTGLQQPISLTNQNVANLADAATKPVNPLNSVGISASIASGSLNNLSEQFRSYQIPTPNIQTITVPIPQGAGGQPIGKVGSFAVGGAVKSDGFAYIHAGEEIRPANVAKGYLERKNERLPDLDGLLRKSRSSKTTQMTISYAPVTNVSGNASAKDLEVSERKNRLEFEKMLVRAVRQANQQSL